MQTNHYDFFETANINNKSSFFYPHTVLLWPHRYLEWERFRLTYRPGGGQKASGYSHYNPAMRKLFQCSFKSYRYSRGQGSQYLIVVLRWRISKDQDCLSVLFQAKFAKKKYALNDLSGVNRLFHHIVNSLPLQFRPTYGTHVFLQEFAPGFSDTAAQLTLKALEHPSTLGIITRQIFPKCYSPFLHIEQII